VVSFSPLPLHLREIKLSYPLYRRFWVGPKVGLDVIEKKKTLPLTANEPRLLGLPARTIIAVPTAAKV
jgi:hypothetical protein